MHLTIRGLVVRVVNYNDADSLLTILTQGHGKLTVKARGVRRKNSPLVAPCQLLAFSEFTLFEYRGYYTVNEAQSIELFTALRRDLCKLSLATYFAQVAEVLSQEDQPDSELLSLVLNCLHVLSTSMASEIKAKAVFELRSACIAGYTPDLNQCHYCKNEHPDLFDISQGRLECSKCSGLSNSGIRMPITAGILDSMRYICYCSSKKLFSFDASNETILELSHITEGYILTQLERGFSALDFYKSLAEVSNM